MSYTRFPRFDVKYRVAEEVDDVKRVELWLTTDGGASWKLHGIDEDLRSPVGFRAERDGQYGFYVVLTDRAGNRSEEPSGGVRPQLTVVVDTRPPKVEMLEPRGGPFGRARGVRIAWRASDEYLADDPVTVEYTADGGQTWNEVVSGQEAAGSHVWRPGGALPAGVWRFRFRISARDRAGNERSVVAVDDLLFDEEAPEARATGPSSASIGGQGAAVEVTYEARDSGASGLESIVLYVTTDGGRTWHRAAVDEDSESPLVWTPERPGEHGLYLVGTDRAGNVGGAPSAGARPQLVCRVSAVGPVVRLATFNTGGDYRGGDGYELAWTALGRGLGEDPVRLDYSLDGGRTWHEIAKDLPAWGAHTWELPRADSREALVRVTATSPVGVSGSVQSARPFVIDSTPPRATLAFDEGAEQARAPLAVRGAPPAGGVTGAGGADTLPEGGGRAHGDGDGEEGAPGPVSMPVQRAPEIIPEPVLRAKEHLAAGSPKDVSLARELTEEFVAREPGHVEANLLLGEARAREAQELARTGGLTAHDLLRRYDEAASALHAALRAEDSSPVGSVNRGHFWLGMCHFHRARTLYRQLRRKDEAMAEAELAAQELDRALETPPNPAEEYCYAGMAHYMLGVAGQGREHALDAEELFEKTLTSASEAPDLVVGSAYYYLADLAARRNNRPKGLEYARKALEKLGPESPYAPQLREMLRRMGAR